MYRACIYSSAGGLWGSFRVRAHPSLIPPPLLLRRLSCWVWRAPGGHPRPALPQHSASGLFPGPSPLLSLLTTSLKVLRSVSSFLSTNAPEHPYPSPGLPLSTSCWPPVQCPRVRLACQHPIHIAWRGLTDVLKMSEQSSRPAPVTSSSPDPLISARFTLQPGITLASSAASSGGEVAGRLNASILGVFPGRWILPAPLPSHSAVPGPPAGSPGRCCPCALALWHLGHHPLSARCLWCRDAVPISPSLCR